MVYARFTHGFRMVYAWFSHGLRVVYPMVFAWFTQGFRMVYTWFTHGFRMVSHGFRMVDARFRMIFAWFSHGFRMVYAIPRNPHLKTSSGGAEAPTCPETSPWPTRSYAIAWFRLLNLPQSQPDHLDSTFRRGLRNLPDSSQMVQMEWFPCPLPAPVTAFPGWNRQEPHRPAVPAEITCQSNSCMQVKEYAIHLGGVFIDDTRSTQPHVFVSIWLSWLQLLQKRHVRTMIFLWTVVCFRLHIE